MRIFLFADIKIVIDEFVSAYTEKAHEIVYGTNGGHFSNRDNITTAEGEFPIGTK